LFSDVMTRSYVVRNQEIQILTDCVINRLSKTRLNIRRGLTLCVDMRTWRAREREEEENASEVEGLPSTQKGKSAFL